MSSLTRMQIKIDQKSFLGLDNLAKKALNRHPNMRGN